jgi:type I restriction enzyme S subunit
MFGSTWLNGGGRKTQFGKVLLQPLRNGVSPSSKGQIPGKVLTLSAVTNSIFNPTAAKVALFAEALNPDKLVSCREFLVCRGNGNLALVGTAKFPTQDMPDTVFPDTVIAARPDPHVLDPRFLEFAWQSPFVREQLRVGARTTNGTYKINQAVLEELWVPLPAMERQQEFSALHQRAFGLTSRLADPGWDTLAHSLMQTFYPDFQSTGAA